MLDFSVVLFAIGVQKIGQQARFTSELVSKISSKYFESKGEVLFYTNKFSGENNELRSYILAEFGRRQEFLLLIYDQQQERKEHDFIQPSGIIVIISFCGDRCSEIIENAVIDFRRRIHRGSRLIWVIENYRSDQVSILFIFQKLWDLKVAEVVVLEVNEDHNGELQN